MLEKYVQSDGATDEVHSVGFGVSQFYFILFVIEVCCAHRSLVPGLMLFPPAIACTHDQRFCFICTSPAYTLASSKEIPGG